MRTDVLVILAAVALVTGFTVTMLADDRSSGTDPGSNATDGAGGGGHAGAGDHEASTQERFALEPGQPFRVELAAADRSKEALTGSVQAQHTGENPFGLIGRAVDPGNGFAGRGQTVTGAIETRGSNGTFIFLAQADATVDLRIAIDEAGVDVDGEPVERDTRSRVVGLTGMGQQSEIPTEPEDLVIEVTNQGAGVVELVDPDGETRVTVPAGGEGYGLVDPVGSWALACPGFCAGRAQTQVVSYAS